MFLETGMKFLLGNEYCILTLLPLRSELILNTQPRSIAQKRSNALEINSSNMRRTNSRDSKIALIRIIETQSAVVGLCG
jgi:hypothetical protein